MVHLKITKLQRKIIFQAPFFGVPAVNFPGYTMSLNWVVFVLPVFKLPHVSLPVPAEMIRLATGVDTKYAF